MPNVSVVIPTRNRERLLCRAIRSVLTQSYGDLECIVVDDGSTDGTPQLMQAIEDDRLVYLRRDGSGGASAARNTGIRAAKGALIAFLDDDDEWLPEKLAKQVALIESLPDEYGMVYCWMDYFDDAGRIVKEHHPTYRGDVLTTVLVRQRLGGCPTLLVKRHVVDEIGGFDEDLPRGNDGDFIRRVCRVCKVDVVKQVLVHVHVAHGYERITSQTDRGIRNHLLAQQAKLDKFSEELRQQPRLKSTLLADIGGSQLRLGHLRAALSNFGHSATLSPANPDLYRAGVWGFKGLLARLTRSGNRTGVSTDVSDG